MLSSGKLIFASVFAIVFIGAMIWAYKKDSISNKIHFKGAYKTIFFIVLLFLALFLFVKLRHLL